MQFNAVLCNAIGQYREHSTNSLRTHSNDKGVKLSRGLGKVQREIVLEVGRFEVLPTNRWELGWLDYSPQSVSRSIRTLRDRGLICEVDGGYKLTTQGLLEYAALVERGEA